MSGASFGGPSTPTPCRLGNLSTRSDGEKKTRFKEVILRSAKITGQISMIGASFDGSLNADQLQVGSALLMRSEGENKADFKGINLLGAKVAGQIDMNGASLEGPLNAESLQVERSAPARCRMYRSGPFWSSHKSLASLICAAPR